MKKLITFLVSTYLTLIILILLLNRCHREEVGGQSSQDSSSIESVEENQPIPIGPEEGQEVQDDEAIRTAETIGSNGEFKVTLLWDFFGDVDLHVVEPSGNTINWRSKTDENSGGFLDVDEREGGEKSAENIFWKNPPIGTYKVLIHYYSASSLSHDERQECKVVINNRGDKRVYEFVLEEEGQIILVKEVPIF